MLHNSIFITGLIALVLSAFLYFVGIPYGITSPGEVQNIVLSPVFWPKVLTGILALSGLGLMATARFASEEERAAVVENRGGYKRLAGVGVLLPLYVIAIPKIGMVWASMIAFIALALLIKTHHRVAALIAAIVVPLLLYAFFAHVAGVSVPQGDFVRLP